MRHILTSPKGRKSLSTFTILQRESKWKKGDKSPFPSVSSLIARHFVQVKPFTGPKKRCYKGGSCQNNLATQFPAKPLSCLLILQILAGRSPWRVSLIGLIGGGDLRFICLGCRLSILLHCASASTHHSSLGDMENWEEINSECACTGFGGKARALQFTPTQLGGKL